MASVTDEMAMLSVSDADVDKKVALIKENIQEVIGEAKMREILKKRDLKLYWGTATTGMPHIGYFVPIMKLADFLEAGCEVTILFADLHAFLDNMKSTWEQLESRVKYYEKVIKAMLKSRGVNLDKLKFVRGTTFQLSEKYTLDVYKLSSIVSEKQAKKAGAEVVKQSASAPLSGLLYPGLQALDEEYLDVDAQFGGVDQRKIFVYAEEFLPKLGYKKRIHIMNPMVPGFQKPSDGDGGKMSASSNAKIDVREPAKQVKKKVNMAWCEPGKVEGNGLLAFCRIVAFKLLNGKPFVIKRLEKWGGDISFDTYADLEKAYADESLFPADLKIGVTDAINNMLEPIRKELDTDEVRSIIAKGYPPEKKQKKKGGKPKKGKNDVPPFCQVNLKVGRITKVWEHPESDTLFCEEIDVGEDTPRQVASGLRKYCKLEDLQDRMVLVVLNLQPRKMAGFPSNGMVMAAKSEDGTKLELIDVPASAKPGDIVKVQSLPDPTPKNKIKIKSNGNDPWSKIVKDLKISDDCTASYNGEPLQVNGENLKVASLTNVQMS
jgi:tyrosyl-tRNA synthetase